MTGPAHIFPIRRASPCKPPFLPPVNRLIQFLTGVVLLSRFGFCATAAESATDERSLFGLTNLWTLQLTISAADWEKLGARGSPQPWNNNGGGGQQGMVEGIVRGIFGNGGQGRQMTVRPPGRADADGESRYPWVSCTLEGAGQKATNASIRFKGVSSMVRAPNAYKRPFKLDFNRKDKDGRFMGLKGFYLNNNVNDATQMREALAYDLFHQAGVAAPRTAFARVLLTIPGHLEKRNLGLYTMVEVVEGDFIKRSFGSKKGLLLKPESMQGLEYMGEDWGAYEGRYHPKGEPNPEEEKRLIEFVRFIRESAPNQFAAHLQDYVDIEPFSRYIALNALMANVDSFIGNGHNYFLHISPVSHKATFIPWDLNESFGMHPVSGPSEQQLRTSIIRPNADPNLLVERFVKDPTLGPVYRAQCAWLLTNVFVASKIATNIERISAVTKPVIFSESKRARVDFERTVLKTVGQEEGDTSQPRRDLEYNNTGYRPWSFPDGIVIDNLPLVDWVALRRSNSIDQLEGKVKGTKPRPRF